MCNTMTTVVQECLELQILEMEMLFSMFPSKEEILMEDTSSMLYARRYLEGIRESLPPTFAFTIFVKTEDPEEHLPKSDKSYLNGIRQHLPIVLRLVAQDMHKLDIDEYLLSFQVKAELHVTLPHTYPQKEPQLFVRSSSLDRQQQNLVNKTLSSHICSLDRGELCITNAVQWLQDNITSYTQSTKQQVESGSDTKEPRGIFHRMWIYSHHIYRQELRKKILDYAKRLNLTGFCLTGKPGVICVEGLKEQCEEFWRDIRYPNWKHISCKHTDSKQVDGKIDDLRLFHSFEELMFAAHGDYGLRNDYHMDLGQFFEFLKQHSSEHIFHILFGIEGRS